MRRQAGMSHPHPRRHRLFASTALAEGMTLSSTLWCRAKAVSCPRATNQNVPASSSQNRSSAVAIKARASSRHRGCRVV